ncbi:ion transporter [Flavobacterium sp. '19STA2R22 D10 B1']|uniref:ion transporter n=1 Tax=Flavobacterium aerium TaxID=3037261 RepID=UPI00278BF18F|nr:ion transporter [Flavobacterium sp. '19STA2R22 D10 B1']
MIKNHEVRIKRFKSKLEILKQKIHIVIYGVNTLPGRLFDAILLVVILLSVVLVMLESVDRLDTKYHTFLVVSEWIITVFFSIEYALRIISNKKPLSYIFSFYGIIDLLSILPMYLSFFIPGSKILSVIRAIRLLRVFRILNLVHFSGQANVLKNALIASRTKIIVFVYFILVVSILLGAVMYVVESKESGFTSIPKSIYWCIVTLTTVGYGDIAPATTLGQGIATFIMILGYGIIAVPTGIVSAEFAFSANKDRNLAPTPTPIKTCPNCTSSGHSNSSNFCYNCGNKLDNEK